VNEQRDFKTKELRYEVVWKGLNPTTGEKWPNELIPASDCNQQLVADWKKTSRHCVTHSTLFTAVGCSFCLFLLLTGVMQVAETAARA